MGNQQYCYVYYSGNLDRDGYVHPEIRIFKLQWDAVQKEHYLGSEIITIKAQIDQENIVAGRGPYGLRIEVAGSHLKEAQKFINAFAKEGMGFNNYRAVLKVLRRRRIPRFTNTRWPEVEHCIRDTWVPFRFRKKANQWLAWLRTFAREEADIAKAMGA